MKAIRIQIDMTYAVPDEMAEMILERDVEFFEMIEKDFHRWKDNEEDPRVPINFELRTHSGDVDDEELENE